MNIKRIGDFPINSKILIRYPKDGKEPTIDFEYPDNERQIKNLWKSSSIGLLAIGLSIVTIMIILILFIFSIKPDYPNNCKGTVLMNNVTLDTTGINLFCNNITRYYFFSYEKTGLGYRWIVHGSEPDSQILRTFFICIIVITLYFILTYVYGKIIAFIVRKSKWGKTGYPAWNKKIHDKHWQVVFTECPDSLQIEIPLFSNVYLDYEAEEEFADYLTEVDIREHDIKYIKTKGLFRKKKTLIPNVYLWKATFKFKKKPIKGYLKVSFT